MGGWRFADLDGFEEKDTQGMALFVPQSWDSPVPGLSCSQVHSEVFVLLQLLFPAGLSLLSPLPGTNQPIPTACRLRAGSCSAQGGLGCGSSTRMGTECHPSHPNPAQAFPAG